MTFIRFSHDHFHVLEWTGLLYYILEILMTEIV
jgi:hypothetical protein